MTAPSGSIALVKRGGCSLATVELKAAGCAWRLRGLGPKQWLLGQCRWQSLCRRLSKGQRLNKECVTACPRFEVVHLCMFLWPVGLLMSGTVVWPLPTPVTLYSMCLVLLH